MDYLNSSMVFIKEVDGHREMDKDISDCEYKDDKDLSDADLFGISLSLHCGPPARINGFPVIQDTQLNNHKTKNELPQDTKGDILMRNIDGTF